MPSLTLRPRCRLKCSVFQKRKKYVTLSFNSEINSTNNRVTIQMQQIEELSLSTNNLRANVERLEIVTANVQNKSNCIEIDAAMLRNKLEAAEEEIDETQSQNLQLNNSNNLLQIQIVRLDELTSELGSTSTSLHNRTESLFPHVSTIEQNIRSLEVEVVTNRNYTNFIIPGMLQF